ncbi:hypothetical protein GDO86_004938, partial [Hymenochirus boettgeri]
AVGNLAISEVDPDGNFVRIVNESPDHEEDLGRFILQQNISGHPMSLYRFPPKTRLMAVSAVTVWATAANVSHQPPHNLLWKEMDKFLAEPRCTTVLCKPNGQAIAWYSAARGHSGCIVVPKTPQTQGPPLPETEPMKQVTEEPRNRQKWENEPVLLRREKPPPVMLPPSSSPWTQNAASPTHPDFSPISPSRKEKEGRRNGTNRNLSTGRSLANGRGPTQSAGVSRALPST